MTSQRLHFQMLPNIQSIASTCHFNQGISFLETACFYPILFSSESGMQRVLIYLWEMNFNNFLVDSLSPFYHQLLLKNYLLWKFSKYTKVERIVWQTMYSSSVSKKKSCPSFQKQDSSADKDFGGEGRKDTIQ